MNAVSRHSRVVRCTVVSLIGAALFSLAAASQEAASSLRGTVRDSQGKAVADAVVRLQFKDPNRTLTARTDPHGSYGFADLPEGVYVLRAAMAGYADAEISSIFIGSSETKNVDLTLATLQKHESSPSAAAPPQFFDSPQFTVAGVTDTTALGGHGSDAVVRTRETLAKEMVSLGKPAAIGASADLVAREQSLRENLERDPSSFDANHDLGMVLLAEGKASEAATYLQRAAQTNPSDSGNSYDLALADAESGRYELARDKAKTLLAFNDKAELHHLLGDIEEKLGDSLEALRQYQRAAEMDPREAYVFDWGSELLLHHAPEPAQEVFTKGNQLFPRSTRMLVGLGGAWFAGGSYDQAVRRICEASDQNPQDPDPYIFLGKMQGAETTPSEQVVEKLRRFVVLEPNSAEANYYYAVALWKLRRNAEEKVRQEEVESRLNTAIRLDPKFAAAHLQLGILQAEQGNYTRAIAEYQNAIQIDAEMDEAHYRLAQAYRQVGEADKAKEEIGRYQELAKKSAQKTERDRHQIRQFVYTLRDQPSPQIR